MQSAFGHWTIRRFLLPGLMAWTALDVVRATTESFEKDTAGWQADTGSVQSTTEHAKIGTHSLRWDFTAGSKLTRQENADIQKVVSTRNGGVKLWLYCEKPLAGDLQVQMGDRTFPVHLGFTGWRAVWVDLAADTTPAPPLQGFQITAPAESGTLFLDAVEFGLVPWFRQGDAQAPYIASTYSGGQYWYTAQDVTALTAPPAPTEITAEQKAVFRQLEQRYDDWMFAHTEDPRAPVQERMKGVADCITTAHRAFELLHLQRKGDVVTGPGTFCELDTLKPHLGYDVFANIGLGLAYDAHLNNSEPARQQFCDLLDYARDQGWAAGSLMGSGYMTRLRMMGYVQGMFILRDYLRQKGRLARELETLRYQSLFNEIYREPVHPGLNADDLRTVLLDNYLIILMEDDSPAKVRDMQCWVRWANSALAIAPGFGETIKPDGTVYHHEAVYATAYGSDAVLMGSITYWLVHDTPFALSRDVGENLKKALLSLGFMGGTYEYPLGVSGRFPFEGPLLAVTSEGMAYMADALQDEELGGAFSRLWDVNQPAIQAQFSECGQRGHRIFLYSSPGSLPWLLDATARWHAQADPQGHRSFPFAGMDFHRRGAWVASVRGWSKYIWSYEELVNANRYGRYSSYGTLQIFGKGTPVDRASSGYVEDGWDWLRPPGATVIRVPIESLAAAPTLQRSYTDDPFLGGVTAEGKNGVWAMSFADPVYDKSFHFHKSVFFVDDTLVCCGSGITNTDAAHTTETELFQVSLPTPPVPLPAPASPTVTTLMDPVGNGYFFPTAQKIELCTQRQVLKNSLDAVKAGTFQLAWIDHGMAPHEAGYAYAIRPNTTAPALNTYAAKPDFEIVQRDNGAHIVRFPGQGIYGYALFASSDNLAFDVLKGVDRPCLVMTHRSGNQVVLSVADPDLKLPPRTKKPIDFEPGAISTFKVHLNGSWDMKNAEGVTQLDDQTLEITINNGRTREVTLTEKAKTQAAPTTDP